MSMNPLLIKVKLPGKIYQLPSKGVFYPKGVLHDDVKDGEIMVNPMSAIAEMKLKSADLLFSGKVIKELCQECIPEILKPDMLLTQDVDGMFMFLRQSTYGDDHIVQSIHDCKNAKLHEYKTNLSPILANPNNSILKNKDELYTVILSNNQKVYTKPNTYQNAMNTVHARTEMHRLESETGKVDESKLESITITDILGVVEAVEVTIDEKQIKVTDRIHITEWIRALPRVNLEELLNCVKTANSWGYQFKINLKCKDCNKEYEHDLDLNPINFFFG